MGNNLLILSQLRPFLEVNGSFLRVNKQKYLKMYSSSIIAVFTTTLLAFASAQSTTTPVTGIRGNATVVENNPVGKVYTATLPEKPFFNPTNPKGNVKGSISATANPNGIGVKTLAHADPYIRGEAPVCDPLLPQTCQTGDLSGKYGNVASDPCEATYSDDFASTLPGIGAYFGNRSFVIHFANKTRISCANFMLFGSNDATTLAPYPTTKPTTVPSTVPA